jgi:aldose 1-epimerase
LVLEGKAINISQNSGELLFSAETEQDRDLGPIIVLKYEQREDPGRSIEVAIAPEFGSNMFHFQVGENNIFYCDRALLKDRDWTGNFPLWPLPNRVRNKKYEFEGRSVSLEDITRKRGNWPLINGLVDDLMWDYEEPVVGSDFAAVKTHICITRNSREYQYFPYESKLTLEYRVTANSATIHYTVKNNEQKEQGKHMPFGFALHPYFATLSGKNETFVTLPADYIMETDEALLPTGRLIDVTNTGYDLRHPKAVGTLKLDTVFTGLHHDDRASVDYRTLGMKVYLLASDEFTHMVLYTLENGFICFELQTGSTDMINLYTRAMKEGNKALEHAAHLLILPPGQSHTGYISYQIEHY